MKIQFFDGLGHDLHDWWGGENWPFVPRIGEYINHRFKIWEVRQVRYEGPDDYIKIWVTEVQ